MIFVINRPLMQEIKKYNYPALYYRVSVLTLEYPGEGKCQRSQVESPEITMLKLSRRNFLSLISTLTLSSSNLAFSVGVASSTERGSPIEFGVAARASLIDSDPEYRDALLKFCSRLTPEIEFKWDQIEPSEGNFNFAAADRLANFARDFHKEIYGHTLLWHRSMPPWVPEYFAAKRDWNIVDRHIQRMMTRYDGVRYWDVINEPIDTGFRDDGLRPGILLETFGEDYIATALHSARSASSSANLLINEYGLEYDLAVEHDRRYHFLKLIERLKQEGVPLNGIGLQAHLDLRKGAVSQTAISDFLKEIANFDLFIFVTELDVKEASYYRPVGERDEQVAGEVSRYLDAVCDFPDIRGVGTWGLTDRYSWLGLSPADVESYEKLGYWRDGSSPGVNRGLPLDADMQPKQFLQSLTSHGVGKI